MKFLFVCVGNSCRSQMAEAIAKHLGYEAESAGTQPSEAVHPKAVEALREIGLDVAGHTPKLLDWARLKEFDRVITMGCGVQESCPALRTDEDWGLEDPVDLPMEEVRRIRDEIERRIRAYGPNEA